MEIFNILAYMSSRQYTSGHLVISVPIANAVIIVLFLPLEGKLENFDFADSKGNLCGKR